MTEPLDLNVLSDRINQIETRAANFEESVNGAIATMMSKIDEVLKRTNICVTPTPNRGGAASATASSLSLLDLAARGDTDAILRMLGDRSGSKNLRLRAENGDTAVHIAAREGHLETVIILLGKVMKVDDPGHLLRTPLHCAASNGHLEVVQRLLDDGAQLDAKDAYNKTPLALAVENQHKHIVDLLAKTMMQRSQQTFRADSLSHSELHKYLKENGVSIDISDDKGSNLVVQAARGGRWKIVVFLLDRGVPATECKDPKDCALVLAARAGQVDTVRRLLRRGAASKADQVKWGLREAKSAAVVWAFYEVVPDAVRGDAGKWALIQAARDGRLEPLQALLDLGVEVDSRDEGGRSALRGAAQKGQIACLRELVRRGAESDADQVKFGLAEAKSAAVVCAFYEVVPDAVRGDAGKWALIQAARDGRLEPLQALLDLGVDVNCKGDGDRTAVWWAAEKCQIACLKELLRRGAASPADRGEALIQAARYGWLNRLQTQLLLGVDVNSRDDHGRSALWWAAQEGHIACLRELLRRGADVNAKDKYGDTPLHRAAYLGKAECVRALLEAGASKVERNNYGSTPRQMTSSVEIHRILDTVQ